MSFRITTLNNAMNLWTLHTPEFSLTDGVVDHEKSEYSQMDGIDKAYQQLHSNLGTDQIIWCDLNRSHIPKTGIRKTLWSLCVPIDQILRFIDRDVWCRIIHVAGEAYPSVSRHLKNQWEDEASALYVNKPDRDEEVARRRNNYWNKKPSGSSWWDELFVPDPSSLNEDLDAILRHPIPESWVLNKEEFVSTSRASQKKGDASGRSPNRSTDTRR